MGTVAITDKLKLEITNNVCAPFNAKYLETALLSASESKILYENLFVSPRQAEMLKELPSRWTTPVHTTSFKDSIYAANKDRHWLKLQLSNYGDVHYIYSWTYDPTNTVGDNVETHRHGWEEFDLATTCQQLIGRNPIADLEKITNERDQTIATIMKMLNGCKTLNQVEKLWPAIRKYVSKETVQRLDHKPARPSIADVGVDKDSLNALSVHHIKTQMTS